MSLEDHRTVPIASPAIGERERERIRDVLDSGMLADSDEMRAFEREFATTCHVDHGVDTGVYYPTPIHRRPAYDHVDDGFPVAERAASEVCSLPVHPGLSEADREAIPMRWPSTRSSEAADHGRARRRTRPASIRTCFLVESTTAVRSFFSV